MSTLDLFSLDVPAIYRTLVAMLVMAVLAIRLGGGFDIED